jgi:hypothetical protein
MWRSLVLCWLLLLAAQSGLAGERFVEREVASRFLNAARVVRIYLPPSYALESNQEDWLGTRIDALSRCKDLDFG